jgi:hypothetical protein
LDCNVANANTDPIVSEVHNSHHVGVASIPLSNGDDDLCFLGNEEFHPPDADDVANESDEDDSCSDADEPDSDMLRLYEKLMSSCEVIHFSFSKLSSKRKFISSFCGSFLDCAHL